MDELIEK